MKQIDCQASFPILEQIPHNSQYECKNTYLFFSPLVNIHLHLTDFDIPIAEEVVINMELEDQSISSSLEKDLISEQVDLLQEHNYYQLDGSILQPICMNLFMSLFF